MVSDSMEDGTLTSGIHSCVIRKNGTRNTLSYRFRLVLITGCPLLNVKKREITDFLWKKAQTVRSFCATHVVKTKLPTKLLIRYFLSSIGKNTFLFFSRLLRKRDP